MSKRKKPIVLRDYPVSREKDSEKYYHRLLILYLPWRSETELENQGTFEQKYRDHQDDIHNTVQQYEPFLEEVSDAAVVCDADNCDEEIWDRLAPQAEQSREEEIIDDPDYQTLDTDMLSAEQLVHNTDIQVQTKSRCQTSLTSHINIEPQEQYLSMIRSLNPKQRQIHDHIFKWCRHINLASSKLEEPLPFYIFLSGGAGVGKSHVVHAIYQTAVRNLRKAGNSADTPTVLLTAPTGKAAVNIGGTTLHSAFHLPVKMRGERFAYKPPATSHLNTLRALYCNMKILIIDEISMVGSRTFSHLNLTLQEIFENELTFGGISVFAVGDLLQLHPVGEKTIYCNEQKGYEALSPSVWDLFLLFELTEVLRQKGDPDFAKLLSRIREGKHTPADLQTLEHLQDNQISDSCISVFLTNALKDEYNSQQLRKLSTQVYTIKANDSKKDLNTRRIPVAVTSTNIHETGGLASEIEVAINARYMHTKNTDIAQGLVNGATGTIKQIEIPSSNPLKGTLYVQFDDKNTGHELKLTSKYKGLVPVTAVSAVFSITEKSTNVQVERTQFPGTLAWGITVHKSQGSTYHEMIADMTFTTQQKTTMPGQIYTMLSRAKSMARIKLNSFHPSKILVNKSALEEMSRLRSHKQLTCDESVHLDQDNDNTLAVTFLNIRSLKAHHEDLLRETSVQNSQVICLCETKLKNYSQYEIEGMVCNSLNTKHGSVIYTNKSIERQEIIIAAKLDKIEAMAVKVKSVSIVSVYIPPTTPLTIVKNDFQCLLQELKPSSQNTCVILGDFNLDNNKRQRIESLAEEFGLGQLVHGPTHELSAVLDLAFTNLPSNVCTIVNSSVCYSDHHAITILLKFDISK